MKVEWKSCFKIGVTVFLLYLCMQYWQNISDLCMAVVSAAAPLVLGCVIAYIHNIDPQNEKIDLDWVRKNSVIVHYYGKMKPWKKGYVGILDVLYHEIQEERERSVTKE